ncbi:unnamed protein product [Hymenolepis diminuta]|uniref:Protein unc-50 n=1 Tax=Hymenolepis diminuta TaxID=6216 RepID=A0A0R3SEL8_HYMDI|nr:unnamed protein product [Hymenolepis diminuta]
MESCSSDFALKNVVVDNNAIRKPYSKRKHSNGLCRQACSNFSLGAKEKAKKYFSRFYKFRQMDFEYASWQMVNIFVSPQKLYRNFSYHHSTRNQWARDDPAFMILLIPWMFISTTIYSAVLGHSFFGWLKLLSWSIIVECIISGLIVASFMWIITNRWMIRSEHSGVVSSGPTSPTIFGGPIRSDFNYRRHSSVASDDESINSDGSYSYPLVVEWAYAFDIHLNALFPCIIILRIIQPIFFYFIRRRTFVGSLIGNTFWLAGILYYVYITFLGYKALPFLRRTRSILLTGTVFVILYVVSVALRWNLTKGMCDFYALF